MEDSEITELFFAREEKALSETKEKYGKLLLSVANGVLGCAEDSEECVNDACLAAWNSIPPARPERLCAYLCKITKNLSLKKYRYLSADKRSCERTVCLEELGDICSGGDSTENEAEARRTGELISVFLSMQKKDTRYIFVRRYWYYDSLADIAEKTGFSEGKIKSVLFRCRAALREYLLGHEVEL